MADDSERSTNKTHEPLYFQATSATDGYCNKQPERMTTLSYSEESLDSMSDVPDGVGSPTFTVTDLLTSLGERTQDAEYLVTKGNDLVLLLQQYPYIKEDLVLSAFGHRLQTLLTHPKKEVVATGYRICRYVIFDTTSIQALISLKLDILIIISLSKGFTCDIEQEQALKLVRKFIETPGGSGELTKGIANAVLSIAKLEDKEHKDRIRIYIETAAEICLVRPDLLPPNLLMAFVIEGPHELSSLCASVILTHLNEPEGRKYIQKTDMLELISPFTDLHFKGKVSNEKIQTSAYILTRFMKNLAGFHGLCLDDCAPLKSLINSLEYPVQGIVSKLLDVFLDVLLVNLLSKKPASGHLNKMVLVPLKLENEFVLNTHYLSLIVITLLQCGIVHQLAGIIKRHTDEATRTKAGFLLTEMANIASNIVPDDMFLDVQNSLARISTIPENGTETRTEFMIEKLTRKSNKGRMLLGLEDLKINENFLNYSKANSHKVVYQVDEATMKQLINDSRVLSTKSFSKWNCDVISDLFKGPFTSGRRLDEINRTTKFMKRLLSFYRPFKHKFSGTKRTKHSQRFIKLGCDIMECLLASQEGIRILKESKIVPQIAECLAQLDAYSGLTAKDMIFSRERLENTLASGYFKMIGVLSARERGLEMLHQFKVFTIMHHIADHPFKRDDLTLMFMVEMNYKKSGHMRVLLSKLLHSENPVVKKKAVSILSDLIDEPECNSFICETLIDQLYEQDDNISSDTIRILSDYCNVSDDNLDQIISYGPSVHILRRFGEQGERLLMKFLSTTAGFGFLQSNGYIDDEFDNWINGERYITYALDVEGMLMNLDADFERDGHLKRTALPPHFFGELVKTEEGFNVIVHSGIMTELVNMIRYYATSLERTDEAEIDHVKLSACMWAIGMISTSELGIETLDVNGCIEDLVQIATSSPMINLRGSAFYVLGLISKTLQGIEILDEFGWSTKMDVYNQSIGITLPREMKTFIGWDNETTAEDLDLMNYSLLEEIDPADDTMKKLFRIIGSLCNHLYLKSSTKDLMTFSKHNPEYFDDPDVFFLVLRHLEMYNYRYSERKVIIEVFTASGRMLEILVKRDKRRMKELVGQ